MPTLNSRVLHPTRDGEMLAVHVFTPAMQLRVKNPDEMADFPTLSVRDSFDDYKTLRLVNRVKFLGDAELVEQYNNPLPGMNGRVVVVCMTRHPVQVWYYTDGLPEVEVTDQPDEVLQNAIALYSRKEQSHEHEKRERDEGASRSPAVRRRNRERPSA